METAIRTIRTGIITWTIGIVVLILITACVSGCRTAPLYKTSVGVSWAAPTEYGNFTANVNVCEK